MKSFAAKTRDALTREDELRGQRPCCAAAELAGFVLSAGSVALTRGGMQLVMRTERAGTARWAVKRFRSLLSLSPGIRAAHVDRLGGRTTFEIRLEARDAAAVLRGLSLSPLGRAIPGTCMKRKCCRAAFLRGAFLGCGTVTDPERGYRLELVFASESMAQALGKFLLAFYGIRTGLAHRKGMAVAYVKDGEGVATLLSVIGAHGALLEMENARIVRDARNRANRAANCDAANIAKMLGAADRHMQAIARIERTIGLWALPEPLREVALERKRHADASLEELGAMLEPPVGKSGVHHRLKRLEAIARSIGEQEKEEER